MSGLLSSQTGRTGPPTRECTSSRSHAPGPSLSMPWGVRCSHETLLCPQGAPGNTRSQMMVVFVLAISRWSLVAEGRADASFVVAVSPSPPCHVARLVSADAVQAPVFVASLALTFPSCHVLGGKATTLRPCDIPRLLTSGASLAEGLLARIWTQSPHCVWGLRPSLLNTSLPTPSLKFLQLKSRHACK